LSGTGLLIVRKSNSRGENQRVSVHPVDGKNVTIEVDLPLTTFMDGGWYWFDLAAQSGSLLLHSAGWYVEAAGKPHGTVTLATTTYNKPVDVIGNLNLIRNDVDLLGVVDDILVVDQGTQRVSDQPEFSEIAKHFGETLEVIEQPNFGGSGGFARGQYEACVRGKSDYVILMDDDISLEPEAIIRLATFADMCIKSTIVGAHMFQLQNRTILENYGEVVDPYLWTWGPCPGSYDGHDFSKAGLRETGWMHQRMDVDYNAWWMCLIPTEVIREIGLSLPNFIKWDDVEYGIRAKKAQYPTVTLPGAAIWHLSWADKDSAASWQAYYYTRNRIMTALIHSPFARGGDAFRDNEFQDLKHLVSMQYYAVNARLMGEEDILAGPEQLHSILASRNMEIRAMAKEYGDSTIKSDYSDFPAVRPKLKRTHRKLSSGSSGGVTAVTNLIGAVRAVLRQVLPVRKCLEEHPQASVSFENSKWWKIAKYDSALVTNAEGTGISWYKRNPVEARKLIVRSVKNNSEILANWKTLRARYRRAFPEITSFEAWAKTFGVEYDPEQNQLRKG
jgi:galactofuranosylgalactofuranosylrhamnosyl-N-acetylglucosaminyl-diphospho-decaprenol beta-1,5/1,6-galactofuranosyltransferase